VALGAVKYAIRPSMTKSEYLLAAQRAGSSKLTRPFEAIAATATDSRCLDLAAEVSFYNINAKGIA
jgi:hypothetical protein